MSGLLARKDRSRRGRAEPAPKGFALLILLLVAALAGTAVVVDNLLPTPRPAAPAPVAIDQPTSGAWYCAVTGGQDETAILSVSAATDEPTTATVVQYPEGEPVRGEPREIGPDDQYDVPLSDGAAQDPVVVEWSGGPAVATWRAEGADSMASTCEPNPAPTWYFTGFDTSAESDSILHLFNPHDVSASARLTFGTPTGEEALVLTENIPVPAGEAVQVDLGEYQPEQTDLAAMVEVLSGRLVAQGSVDFTPTENQPGPEGRDIIAGTTTAADLWGFADGRDDEEGQSWISVFNPNEREAAVRLRLSDPLPESPAVLGETSVPPGSVVRLELSEAAAQPGFATIVESVNGIPVVTSRTTHVDGDAEGVAISAGSQPANQWAVAGGGTGDRDADVVAYNPTADPIEVTVDAGADTPDGWSSLSLGANERVPLPLTNVDDGRDNIPVRAQGTGPFLLELRSAAPGDQLQFWSTGAVPSWVWEGPETRPYVERDPSLATRPLPRDTSGVFVPDPSAGDPFDYVPDDIELAPTPRRPSTPDPDDASTPSPSPSPSPSPTDDPDDDPTPSPSPSPTDDPDDESDDDADAEDDDTGADADDADDAGDGN